MSKAYLQKCGLTIISKTHLLLPTVTSLSPKVVRQSQSPHSRKGSHGKQSQVPSIASEVSDNSKVPDIEERGDGPDAVDLINSCFFFFMCKGVGVGG
jgi:hypothetical protein